VKCEISLDIPAKELKARLKAWKPKKPRATQGVLAKYAKLVATASEGAVTDKYLADERGLGAQTNPGIGFYRRPQRKRRNEFCRQSLVGFRILNRR
jgi:hypothetical protein